MNRIDENLSVTTYLRLTARTIDGQAWLATCIASLILAIGLNFDVALAPLRDIGNKPKAMVLLLSSPLIIFLILVRLRQTFSGSRMSVFIRAGLCIIAFLAINFYDSRSVKLDFLKLQDVRLHTGGSVHHGISGTQFLTRASLGSTAQSD
ncbi:hypothetical protein [Ralstonia solanacearum]|uniref:hypothetical protein n=1 Tax=Ralstonia solanacearum TaxID=305 RepID=UPI0018D12808|nr:hypothetical protein [Ralstonia solanacearum]